MSYDDRRGHPFGLHDPRAPWRRAARPLAILFVVQLSGIGCAARAPQIPTPTKPDELKPYLTVYQDQLEGEGITLEGAEETARVVIVAFTTLEQAKKFYDSPEYQEAKAAREGAATGHFVVVEGVAPE